MEIFFEKNIVNMGIDKHKKRNIVFNALRIAGIVLLILEILFIFTFQPFPTDKGAGVLIFSIVVSLGILLFPIMMILIFTRLLNNLNAEFDYFIMGNTFRIVRVINRKKRKKFLEIPISAVSNVGLIESDNFDRYNMDKTVKKVNAFCNDDSDLGYFFCSADGEKKLLILEFDLEFLTNLRKATQPMIFDDTVKAYMRTAQKQ